MLDFNSLKAALAPLSRLGQDEVTFEVEGVRITMRPTLPHEEREATRYALSDLNEDTGIDDSIEYVERFRIATLSFAIVQIGDLDLRDVTHIETGEMLDDGVKVKIPKAKALRNLLTQWTSATLVRMAHKYREMMTLSQQKAERAIVFNPSDVDTEIERLEARINELKEEKAAQIKEQQEEVAKVKGVEVSPLFKPVVKETPQPVEEPVDPQLMPPAQRVPITPTTMQDVPPNIEPALPRKQRDQEQLGGDSSFIDPTDDNVQATMEAEHRRLLAMRRQGAQELNAHAPKVILDPPAAQSRNPRFKP